MKARYLGAVLLILVCLGCAAQAAANNSGAKSKSLTLVGRLEAYGSAPHVVWMIRDRSSGALYYPAAAFQKKLAKLGTAKLYAWRGLVDPPLTGLQELIPAHAGVFKTLKWTEKAD